VNVRYRASFAKDLRSIKNKESLNRIKTSMSVVCALDRPTVRCLTKLVQNLIPCVWGRRGRCASVEPDQGYVILGVMLSFVN
jgi:hypothetical protein